MRSLDVVHGADNDDAELMSELLVARGVAALLVSGGGGSAGDQRSDRALLALFVLIEGDGKRSWRLYSGHVMETDSALN